MPKLICISTVLGTLVLITMSLLATAAPSEIPPGCGVSESNVFATGQTACWDAFGNSVACSGTGQDGDTTKGVAWPEPRFTVNGDGTVTDELTGLIWLRWVDCFATYTAPGVTLNWDEALTEVASLADGQCGLTDGSTAGDWRLPNTREYLSLVNYQFYFHAIPNTAGTGQLENGDPFICASCLSDNMSEFGFFWTSTTSIRNTAQACAFEPQNGYVSCGVGKFQGSQYNVGAWAVRDAPWTVSGAQ